MVSPAHRALNGFSPATRGWFTGAFDAPTTAQAGAWQAIAEGSDVLVVAPTGSGKTLAALLAALDRWIGAPPEAVLDAWRSRDALRGGRVRWADGEGIADGIDDSGALLVQTDDGPVTLDAGEVHLHR